MLFCIENDFQFYLDIYRKIYALDIFGEIPKELFELKKLKDL